MSDLDADALSIFHDDQVYTILEDTDARAFTRLQLLSDSSIEDTTELPLHRQVLGLLYNPYCHDSIIEASSEYFEILLISYDNDKAIIREIVFELIAHEHNDTAKYFYLCAIHYFVLEAPLTEPEYFFDSHDLLDDAIAKQLRLDPNAVRCLSFTLLRFYRAVDKIEGDSLASSALRTQMWNACFGEDLMDALHFGAKQFRRRNVMILGDQGTGKQLVAEVIMAGTMGAEHEISPPQVQCSAPEVYAPTFQAELFGVVERTHTEVDKREGKIESAHRGTLFIDEIADMSPDVQAGLLRVIQEGSLSPLGGGSEPRRVDVRYITATNEDMEALVESKAFRSDLYSRLSAIVIEVASLDQRRGDIVPIAESLLDALLKEIQDPASEEVLRQRFEVWRFRFELDEETENSGIHNVRDLQKSVYDALFGQKLGIPWKVLLDLERRGYDPFPQPSHRLALMGGSVL